MDGSTHSRHASSGSTERVPLIDKAHDQERVDALTAPPRAGKTTNEKFVAVLIFGCIAFVVTIYYVYAFFVVGSLRCASGHGYLVVQNIHLSDLKNAEIIKALDSNDPYVEVQFDGVKQETSVRCVLHSLLLYQLPWCLQMCTMINSICDYS